MERIARVGSVVLLVATVASAQGKPGGISGDIVKIGVLTDLSGLYSDLSGPGWVIAAHMAVDELGGKDLGNPTQKASPDTQTKPMVAANRAPEWFDREGVVMFSTFPNPSTALPFRK